MSGPTRPTMARRGSIGASWWSRRFIDPLEATGDQGRLSRGRSYARRGAVLDVTIRPGVAISKVQGSRPRPYTVTVSYAELDDGQWGEVCTVLAGKALFRSALLAGEMPPEIEDVLAARGVAMFPERFDDLDTSCSCPDWGFPCKHVAAVLYVLADTFDADPFAVLAWLGRDRDTLLAEIRAHAPASDSGGEPREHGLAVRRSALVDRADTFWVTGQPPTLTPAPAPMSPLAYLDDDSPKIAAVLEPLYDRLAEAE